MPVRLCASTSAIYLVKWEADTREFRREGLQREASCAVFSVDGLEAKEAVLHISGCSACDWTPWTY